MNNLSKQTLRKKYNILRKTLSINRKKEATNNATFYLKECLQNFNNILSFSSLTDEINLWEINELLFYQKKLNLPKIFNKHLKIYKIENFKNLQKHPKLSIFEPNPITDIEILDLNSIDCVLVPGLLFDQSQDRIGYGGGYYDKLLPHLKNASKIGLCFKEQTILQSIQASNSDISLDKILSF